MTIFRSFIKTMIQERYFSKLIKKHASGKILGTKSDKEDVTAEHKYIFLLTIAR